MTDLVTALQLERDALKAELAEREGDLELCDAELACARNQVEVLLEAVERMEGAA